MGLTSPNSPVIVGQEFSPRQLQGQTHLAVGFECRRSSGLFRFIIIRLFWCRLLVGEMVINIHVLLLREKDVSVIVWYK